MAYINTCKVDNPHLATFLLGYLYLSDMWFGVARRMHTKKHIFKEIWLHAQNVETILNSIFNMIGRKWGKTYMNISWAQESSTW